VAFLAYRTWEDRGFIGFQRVLTAGRWFLAAEQCQLESRRVISLQEGDTFGFGGTFGGIS
jgi:hypothetical protein